MSIPTKVARISINRFGNVAEAVYDSEIPASHPNTELYVDYFPRLTERAGRITAKAIAAEVTPLDDYAVMLCGPSTFVADLAR